MLSLQRFLLVFSFAINSPVELALHAAPPVSISSARLQACVDVAVAGTLADFAGIQLRSNQLAVTLVDLFDLKAPEHAAYRGSAEVYPASVVKLFYLVAAHQWMQDRHLADTPELRRAMRDMIVDSSNDATHYVVDLLTGTTSGPELSEREIDQWFEKRNAVNRYFASLGYRQINVNKKPWCEGPYGRETQSIQRHQPKRNMLTTDATARLLAEIVTGGAVTPMRSAEMLKLLERDPFKKIEEGNEPDQGNAFTGLALKPGDRLWSKAGFTSEVRHDAAYLVTPSGSRLVLVTFTEGHSAERQIIPTLARKILQKLAASP